MPIQSTLVSGPSFCVYRQEGEMFSPDPPQAVTLTLHDCEFQASSPGNVSIRIPMAVWEFIRRHPAMDFALAAKSDPELEQEAGRRVTEEEDTDRQATGLMAALRLRSGMPHEERLAEFLDTLKRARAFQQQVLAEIARYERENPHAQRDAVPPPP